MLPRTVPEPDWKIFRQLREVALERLCERALGDAAEVLENPDKTHHERFRELFGMLVDRDREIARGFDGPRRSTMLEQLAFMYRLGLLETGELARFSDSTRETVETLANL